MIIELSTKKKRRKQKIKEEFGRQPAGKNGSWTRTSNLEEIRLYYDETKEGLPSNAIDEITWNDLEMDRVFERINHTRSFIGEQVLYRRLHLLREEAQNREMEQRLNCFTEQETMRVELELELEKIGKNSADYSLPGFLLNADSWSYLQGK